MALEERETTLSILPPLSFCSTIQIPHLTNYSLSLFIFSLVLRKQPRVAAHSGRQSHHRHLIQVQNRQTRVPLDAGGRQNRLLPRHDAKRSCQGKKIKRFSDFERGKPAF